MFTNTPLVVHELAHLGTLPAHGRGIIHVRLVRFNDDPTVYCDIRKHVETKGYTGFAKGISLTREQLVAALPKLTEARATLAGDAEKPAPKKAGRKAA